MVMLWQTETHMQAGTNKFTIRQMSFIWLIREDCVFSTHSDKLLIQQSKDDLVLHIVVSPGLQYHILMKSN